MPKSGVATVAEVSLQCKDKRHQDPDRYTRDRSISSRKIDMRMAFRYARKHS